MNARAHRGPDDVGLGDLIDEVKQTAQDLGTVALRTTQERPLAAVTVAAVVGFAVGGGMINRLSGKLVMAALQAALAGAARERILGRGERASGADAQPYST